jgi:hypothetical protein
MKEGFLKFTSWYLQTTGSAVGLYTAMLSLERVNTGYYYIPDNIPPGGRRLDAQRRASKKYEEDMTRVPMMACMWPLTIACGGARLIDWAAGGESGIFQDSFIELGTVHRELEREKGRIRS